MWAKWCHKLTRSPQKSVTWPKHNYIIENVSNMQHHQLLFPYLMFSWADEDPDVSSIFYGLIVECVSFMCYKFRTFNTSIQCWIIKIFLKDKNRKKCNSSIEENPNTDWYPVKLQIETDSSKRLFLGTQYLLFTVLFKKNFHQIYLHLKILLRRLKAKDQ